MLKIAFCTTCKGRAQHVKLTLPRNLDDNLDYLNAVFILVNYGSQDDLMEYLYDKHHGDMAIGRLQVYSLENAGTFQMAHAKNLAHRLALLEGADLLVNLDADNFTGPGFATYLYRQVREHGDRSFWWSRMLPGVLPRGISGRIAVTRDAYLNVGGYDERFADWGRDDKNFNERLRRAGYSAQEIDSRYLDGVRHNDKIRFREYPHARTCAHEDALPAAEDEASGATIANFGRFGCGVLTRADGLRIELQPVPTRVFGVGMHKTGTTSLHAALTLLGFHSGHWESAHWAKAIWTEMTALGRSSTLEQFYAVSDLPIGLLYRELDAAYPGSKFILTVRDEQGWLNSVERHWSKAHNPFRKQWDTDPFTHRLHREVYGRKSFDREIFLARYRRHNADVIAHFKDRPTDLLILDMEKKNHWAELCPFLDRPKPPVPYPRMNAKLN